MKIPKELQAKIVIDDSGCWLWQGYLNQGYGTAYLNRKRTKAHRLIYELLVGKIPDGMCTDHLCRVRACVNPAHIEIVTNKVNILRGIGYTAQQARQTVCKKGHPLSAENLYVGPKGFRVCKICKRLRVNAWRKKQRGKDVHASGG